MPFCVGTWVCFTQKSWPMAYVAAPPPPPPPDVLRRLPPPKRLPKHIRYPLQLTEALDPWWLRVSVNCTLLTLTGVVLGESVSSVDLYRNYKRLGGVDMRMISNGIVTSSIFFWPVLFDNIIGLERLTEQPRICFGFFWPMIVSTFDLRYAMDKRLGNSMDMNRMTRELGSDAQSVVSVCFAVGALLSGLKSLRGTHIILYSLVLCLALVIPQVATPNNTPDRAVILSAQKASLNYAIGFLISALSADLLEGGASKPLFGRM